MKVIQVIGLPGVGKTTAILAYLEEISARKVVSYVDIAYFSSIDKEYQFMKAIERIAATTPVIAESACGIYIPGSYVIKYEQPLAIIYAQLYKRDGKFDEDYLSLLAQSMLQFNYVAYSAIELITLLHRLI